MRALTVLTLAAPEVLLEMLEKLCQEKQVESFTELTKDIHFYPDFHGKPTYFDDATCLSAL